MKYSDPHTIGKIILPLLQLKIEGLQLVYIFGSVSKNNTHRNSDIDVAFVAQNAMKSLERYKLKTELEVLVNNDLDLVDLKNSGSVLKAEVIYGGTLIFSSLSEDDRLLYESRVMEDYLDYKELIRPLEDEIIKRGQVF